MHYISEIADALDDYNDASREVKECIERVEYDAGYFCAHQRDRRDRAQAALKLALDNWLEGRLIELGILDPS